jgi:tetratricopeptide (TPR) repeat protein
MPPFLQRNGGRFFQRRPPAEGSMKPLAVGLVFVLVVPVLHAQSQSRRTAPIQGAPFTHPDFYQDPFTLFATTPEPPRRESVNPVSAKQLLIPSKAAKEFERSQKAFQAGDVNTSVEHLQKAVKIYPSFVQAHNVLGLRYLQLGEYQKALAEHETALAIDPHSAQTHQDVAMALLLLNRYPEGEAEARQAMDLDPQAPASRYLLGRAIVGQGRVTPEALEMLRSSETAFPDASLVVAHIMFGQGRINEVVVELRAYLKNPTPDNGPLAACWLAQLTHTALPANCSATSTPPSFH